MFDKSTTTGATGNAELLTLQGYRIDYCAAADALTHAPETFSEFFNQRRRWGPSTLANICDLLGDWKNTDAETKKINTNNRRKITFGLVRPPTIPVPTVPTKTIVITIA
jgi:hypothetical protein